MLKIFTHTKPDTQKITRDSFESLYRTYWKKMYTLCLNKVQDPLVAEEIVQEIFRSVWERRDSLEFHEPAEHYLLRATKLEIAGYFRKMVRRESILNTILCDFNDIDNGTVHRMDALGLDERIRMLLKQLPDQTRSVFILSREKGFSNREIADRMSLSVKTVEYHISKVLSHLRKNLKEFV